MIKPSKCRTVCCWSLRIPSSFAESNSMWSVTVWAIDFLFGDLPSFGFICNHLLPTKNSQDQLRWVVRSTKLELVSWLAACFAENRNHLWPPSLQSIVFEINFFAMNSINWTQSTELNQMNRILFIRLCAATRNSFFIFNLQGRRTGAFIRLTFRFFLSFSPSKLNWSRSSFLSFNSRKRGLWFVSTISDQISPVSKWI